MKLATKRCPVLLAVIRAVAVTALVLPWLTSLSFAADKTDEVWLKNGDHLTGEIKRLERGVFYFKPAYVLDSIEIDWTKVDRIESKEHFNIVLTSGATHSGT